MNDILPTILGRDHSFLREDMEHARANIKDALGSARVLVIGAAGSIGSAFVTELAQYGLGGLHLLDVSENNLVEVVRQLRSGGIHLPDDFRTYAIDFSAMEMAALLKVEQYDYVLNFSALKHVRSERDPYTLMRLLEVNVAGNARLLDALAGQKQLQRVFSVSSDKSVRPANLMGASKAFMERIFLSRADEMSFTSARFANVAFSDGSLLHSFRHRFEKRQPLSAPSDVLRYFITHEEAGQLCLLSCFDGNNREIYFPQFRPDKDMMSFADIARTFLHAQGYRALECDSDAQALAKAAEMQPGDRDWPCYFSGSDTSGEKMYEEFNDPDESLDLDRYQTVGVVTDPVYHGREGLDKALAMIEACRTKGTWTKEDLVRAVATAVPELNHVETHKNLDQKM
ncbi:MAG: polysaccharide biosynthesis protein [Akkermansiaceae bacterium]|nr:polysaccharide biosynthesis protein [Akkermansiaceae bacterium]